MATKKKSNAAKTVAKTSAKKKPISTKTSPAAKALPQTKSPVPLGKPAIATSGKSKSSADLLLVCLQDPFTQGTWILHRDDIVPCDDGNSAHLWQLRAGFELLAPRMLEGQFSRVPVAMNLKGLASAGPSNNANWAPTVRLETSTAPPLKLIVRVNNSGKVEFSLASGAKHPEGKPLPFAGDRRAFNTDVAFATNGPSGFTAAATAVISTLPWAQLIAGSAAATKGLAFDTGWMRNLRKGSETTDKKGKTTTIVPDGATIAQDSWAFAAMTRAEYETWCASENRPPSEFVG
jgi:hypothetical protein